MDERATLRFSALRMVALTTVLVPVTAVLAFMALLAFLAGGASGLIILLALLPVVVVCAATTGLYVGLGVFTALRDWAWGYRIRYDDATGTLRDTEGRVVRLDKSQPVRCIGRPPFDIYIFDDTGTGAQPGPDPRLAWLLRLGFGPVAVLDAIRRGDLVLPLVFIRGRAVFVRLMRRCRLVTA